MIIKEFFKQLKDINSRKIIYPMISILFLFMVFVLSFETIYFLIADINRISNIENINPEKELINFKIGEFERLMNN